MDHFLWFVIRSSKTVEAWITCLWLRITTVTVLNEDRWHLIEKHQTHKLTPLTSSLIHVWLPHFGSRNTSSFPLSLFLSLRHLDTVSAQLHSSGLTLRPRGLPKANRVRHLPLHKSNDPRALASLCELSRARDPYTSSAWPLKNQLLGCDRVEKTKHELLGQYIKDVVVIENDLDIPPKMVPKWCKRTFQFTFMIGLSIFTNIIQVWYMQVRSDIMFIHLSN